VYDGNQVAADLDGSGNVLRTYAWGPGIDNLLSLTVWSGGSGSTPTATYYPLKDHQNSVVALVDALGNVVESYRYDAYGRTTIFDSTGTEIANHQSAVGNRYLWQGREYDSATGLYYFRARWYIPGIEDSSGRSLGVGRWLSKDPIGISGGLNLYVFCGNNPINFTDPFGECEKGYWDRYMEHLDKYAIKLDPAVVAGLIGGGVMPKSWAPATGGRGPLLGSDNPLTSVLRGLGVPGAGAAVVRGGAAAVGVAGVGIGTYNTGVLVSGLVYAAFPGSNGL
jgi:RHS repeat-associated protein